MDLHISRTVGAACVPYLADELFHPSPAPVSKRFPGISRRGVDNPACKLRAKPSDRGADHYEIGVFGDAQTDDSGLGVSLDARPMEDCLDCSSFFDSSLLLEAHMQQSLVHLL